MSDQREPGRAKLLDAVMAVGAELELEIVLRRIVAAAVDLLDARYGALGVLADDDRRLAQLVHVGMDRTTVARIGAWPALEGVLGLLIDGPIRSTDVTAHPRAFGFPPGHPPMSSFLGVPIRVRGRVFGNLYLAEKKGGGQFTAEDEQLALALATAAGIAVQNARLYEESRQREAWLRAASEITRLLLAGVDEAEVYAAIAEHVRQLSGATDAGVLLPRDGQLRQVAGVGELGRAAIGLAVDPDRTITGSVFRSGATANLTEADVEAEVEVATEITKAHTTNPHLPRVGPTLLVPLGAAGRTRGVLTASRPPGAQPFSAQTVSTVEGFAEQAELACELAERRRHSEELSLLADRDRIARNLHDLVIQRLYATGMALQGVPNLIEVRPAEARARIERAVGELDTTIREIRTTVFALQHSAGRSRGLRGQLVEVVEAAAATLGFMPSLQFDGLLDAVVPDDTAEHLLAVLREALSNVARHARASAVRITVAAHDQLVLLVGDDGVGMRGTARHSGLANMAARAAQLGGELEIHDGRPGLVLRWSVPLQA